MLIAFFGKAGSGKDTSFERAALIAGELGLPAPVRIAFADLLKDSVCALFDITRDELEEMKVDENATITLRGRWLGLPNGWATKRVITMRRFLQRYGDKSHRGVFGDDFWIDQLLPSVLDHRKELLMVTDTRYENEAAAVRGLGGKVIHVLGETSLTGEEALHSSEAGIADRFIDYSIDNSDRESYDSLDQQLLEILAAES